MEPAYHDGDRVLVRRGPAPAKGQVVVVERPRPSAGWRDRPVPSTAGAAEVSSREWMIKRVVAVPGDPVPRVPDSVLSGVPEPRVSPGQLVLFGDNSKISLDSRRIGYFPIERVLGPVVRPLPPDRRKSTRHAGHSDNRGEGVRRRR